MEKTSVHSTGYQHFAEQLQYVIGHLSFAQITRKLVITPFCVDNELRLMHYYQ